MNIVSKFYLESISINSRYLCNFSDPRKELISTANATVKPPFRDLIYNDKYPHRTIIRTPKVGQDGSSQKTILNC